MSRNQSEWWLSMPSLLWLGTFIGVPMGIILVIAFRPSLPSGGVGDGWSADAIQSLNQPVYFRLLGRTLWISAATTVACVVLSLPVVWCLVRASGPWKWRLLLLLMMPFWTNFLIRVFAWQQILHAEGVVASGLRWLGILGEGDRLLGNSMVVVLVSVYTYLPFAILPLYAAAERFDFQLIDAARDLGAKPLRSFFSVFLPGVRRGLVSALLLVFIPMLGSYVIPDLVGGEENRMLGNKIAQRNFNDRNLPQAAALAVALGLLVLLPVAVLGKEDDG